VKADLHVHSYHSGYARPFRWLRARDSYSSPFDVYRVAKARGMDLVCLTDHDSIDGGLEFLNKHPDAPDFILGEEIEAVFPDAPGLRVHLGALGMTEAHHREVQRLRSNVFDVASYLTQQNVFFGVNHLFFFFRDEMPAETYVARLMAAAPAVETRNGAMLAEHNALIADIAVAARTAGRIIGVTGGSDAHTLRCIGTTYTESPATTREEFMDDVRAGRARVCGAHGGVVRMMAEVYASIFTFWRSLAGLERHDLTAGQRVQGALYSIALLPFQFLPAAVAWRMHAGEARRVGAYRAAGIVGRTAPETAPAATMLAPQ